MNRKHIIFYTLLLPLVAIYLKVKFNYKYEKARDLPDNYIVLSNHTTDYDPLFVGVSFKKQMYFVASEHIARWKFLYKLIDFLVAPITRPKGTVATSTAMDILRKAKKGANVCIFAEGARTWDGVTGPIAPATAKLIKNSGCALVTYKITGGYFVSPRWSTNLRRGPIHGAPVNIYTKEQLSEMTADEIYDVINRDLYEDAYARQLEQPQKYSHKAPAIGMENFLFICPKCGAHDSILSLNDSVHCSSCNMTFTYDVYGMLSGIPQRTIRELALWQRTQVDKDVLKDLTYHTEDATLSEIIDHQEILMGKGCLSISSKGLTCGEFSIPLDSISDLALHGKRGLVFSVGKKYYEAKPSENANGLKFMEYYESYKRQQEKVGT